MADLAVQAILVVAVATLIYDTFKARRAKRRARYRYRAPGS